MTPSSYEGHYSHSSLQPVPNYVHRPALHEQLRRQFQYVPTGRAEEPWIGVVWGLGGAGKSQLVRKYINTYRQDYSAVFWIEAGSKESIERDYIQIYRLLYGRPVGAGQETLKVEDAVPAVKHWFHQREGRWLVVLDSADSIDDDRDRSYIDLQYFMPDSPGVHILITSRSATAREMTRREAVEVADMESSEAVELFQRCAKMQNPGPDVTMEVGRIVQELGYLALAITLAGSYVSVTPRLSADIRRYLPEYHQRRTELLRRRPQQQIHRYGESVLSTWEASFDAVATQSPTAARLLGMLASMNFDDIFLRMFDRNADGVSAQSDIASLPIQTWRSFLFPEIEWSLYQLESAFEVLQRYALIQWKWDQQSYSMHKLVHAWGQDRQDGAMQLQTNGMALELLADATADGQSSPGYKLRLVPHVMANFAIYVERADLTSKITRDRLDLISRIEGFLYTIGRWSEAFEVQAFHLRKTEETFGKEHPNTLTSMSNLASVLRFQGKYDEAEGIHRQVLALRESVLGKEHPSTLKSMANLALTYGDLGRWPEAELLGVQVKKARIRVLGEQDPDTLASKADLVWTYYKQGRLEEAEELGLLVKESRIGVLTEEHPDTLTSMAHLGAIYEHLGRSREAEKWKKRVLEIRMRVLGGEHPATLISMVNLALTYRRLGRLKEAEDLEVEALDIRERVLGLDHPSTLMSMNNLAWTWRNQGRHDEAISLMKICISTSIRKLGRNHPSTQDRLWYWGTEPWKADTSGT